MFYGVSPDVLEVSRKPVALTFAGQRDIRLGTLELRAFGDQPRAYVLVDVREVRYLRYGDVVAGHVCGTYHAGRFIAGPGDITGLGPEDTVTIICHGGPIPDTHEPCVRCDRLVLKES